jgi:hypothetical protein
MTKPKAGGYTHRRLVGKARRATGVAVEKLRRATEVRSAKAQALHLASCSLALAEVTAALADIEALLNDAPGGSA